MLANANTSPRHFASEHANARRGLRLAVPTWGRSVCYAGIACMLAGSLVPSALADGNPSIGWEPEVPSIDPNEPSGGEEPGGNETPDTPEPPVVDPEPEVPVEPDPPISDPEPEIPDSGTTAPDPDYLYPNGSGSVGGEGAFYDPEYPADSVPPAEEQPADPAVSAAVTVPVFGSYDAGTGVLSGSAQPGVTVRVVDGAGNVVGDVVVDENGVFSIALPAGTDLSGLSIYVVDGEGNQVGDVLSGATVVQEIARQEFEAVRTATGASTVDLAERLSDAVGRVKTAEFIDEPEREGMPVLPYAIGAASAVFAVGAVGAGVALYRRHTPKDGRNSQGRLTPNLSAAGLQTTPAPVVAPDVKTGDAAAQTPGAANANDTFARMDAVLPNHPNGHADVDELDELEMLAMSLHGNPTSRTAKPRLAVDVQTPSDGDDDPNPPDGPGGGAPIDPGSTAAFLSAMGAVRPTPSASGAVGLQQRGVSDGSDGNTSLPTIFMSKAAFEADPETTLISSPFDERPLDDESFARLAHILATGTGKVHRVTRSYSDLDLAGLDLLDEGQHTSTSAVVADPLAARDDWQEVALRELAAPAVEPVREYPQLSTDDYVALVSTQRRQSVDDGASRSQIAYVGRRPFVAFGRGGGPSSGHAPRVQDRRGRRAQESRRRLQEPDAFRGSGAPGLFLPGPFPYGRRPHHRTWGFGGTGTCPTVFKPERPHVPREAISLGARPRVFCTCSGRPCGGAHPRPRGCGCRCCGAKRLCGLWEFHSSRRSRTVRGRCPASTGRHGGVLCGGCGLCGGGVRIDFSGCVTDFLIYGTGAPCRVRDRPVCLRGDFHKRARRASLAGHWDGRRLLRSL